MMAKAKYALCLLGALALLVSLNTSLYRLDEWLGCDLADDAQTCIVRGIVALGNWFNNSNAEQKYGRFLPGGADHGALVQALRAACIHDQRRDRSDTEKTDTQIATFCDCTAKNTAGLATANELQHLAKTSQPTESLQEKVEQSAVICKRSPKDL